MEHSPNPLADLPSTEEGWSPFPVKDRDENGTTYAGREMHRIAAEMEKLGLGYTRMEQCVMDLCRDLRSLVEQNAALIQAMAEEEQEAEEPVGYLSSKKR